MAHIRIDIAAAREERARGNVDYFEGLRRDAIAEGDMRAYKKAEREIAASTAMHQQAMRDLAKEKEDYG